MKYFIVANRKGGVGKTTTCRNVIFDGAKRRNKRMLGIDFDLQGNLTKSLLAIATRNGLLAEDGDERESALGNSQLFSDEPLIPIHCDENIDLIPASESLALSEDMDLTEMVDYVRTRLSDLAGNYDLCVIDTSPTVTKLLVVALAIGDFALSPCEPDEDSIDGLLGFFANVNDVTQRGGLNERLVSLGVLLNKVKKDRAHQMGLIRQMRDAWGDNVMQCELPDRAAISTAKERPVWLTERGHQSKSAAAQEMLDVCDMIFQRLGLD